jgi:hypothetical protein
MKKSLLRWFGSVAAAVILLSASSAMAQTYTIGANNGSNTTTGAPCPMQDYYKQSKAQYLYKASELSAAGMSAGDITSLAWTVTSPYIITDLDGGKIEGYTIKIGTTATTSLGTTTWESGASTVWGPTDYTPAAPAVAGDPAVVNTFTFDVPFYWDGVSNIFVEVCGGLSTGEWEENAACIQSTAIGFNGSRTYRSDTYSAVPGAICDYVSTVTAGTATTRPQVIFGAAAAVDCEGTPEVGAASSTAASVCAGETFTLSVDPITGVGGISYQWESSADGVSYSAIGGATAASYIATQSSATYYQCVVTCSASGESGTSAAVWVGQNGATECYCEPTFTSILSGDYIDDFAVGTISNYDSGEDADNYADYTDVYSTDLNIGASYDVFVDCGPSWDQGIGVWIDMNVDGSFTADERLNCALVDASTGGTTYSITVPDGTAPGTTRMRVMAKYADACTSLMDDVAACTATASFGETEDYTVNLIAVETCVPVTGLSADAGTTSATLSWDDMGATKYRIAYGQVGVSSSITNVQTFGTSITLTGLVSGGSYSARVSRDCYPDGWSAYAQINWTNGMRLAQVEADVLVYPNPSNGNFRLQINGYENTDMTVLITNAIGQVVYNSNIAVNETITVQDINLSDLAAGTYTLKLVNGDNVTTRNIVIE